MAETGRVNKKILGLHFSNNAAQYESRAVVQREIAFQLAQWAGERDIPGWRGGARVLEIGCGTGFLTRQLDELLEPASLTALDLAPGMLRTLAGEETAAGRCLVCADGEHLPFPPASFDLVASSTTFQWFQHLEESFRGISSVLAPGGGLVFSSVGPGTFSELKESYQVAAGQMGITLTESRYGPHLPGTQELEQAIRAAGLEPLHSGTSRKLEFFASPLEFMRSVKRRGASNPNYRPMSLPVERELMQRVVRHYQRRFTVDGRVYAGYEVIFMAARKV